MSIVNKFYRVIALSIFVSPALWAGDDPSIKGDLRSNIHTAMSEYINHHTVDNKMFLFDASKGKLLKLKFDNLHSGIVKKGGFYVSCADFYDQNNRKIDVDFLVVPKTDKLITTQAIVHSIDGKKRKYHLENL